VRNGPVETLIKRENTVKIRKNATLDCTYDPVNLIPFLSRIKTFRNIARIRNAESVKNPRMLIRGLIRFFVGF